MRILFVDPKSSTPYDSERMRIEGIGGTEASLVRVVEGLAEHHSVAVAQLGRQAPATCRGVHYVPLAERGLDADPDLVVVLRKHRLVSGYRRRFPNAALCTWVHNWQRPEAALQRVLLARAKVSVVAVSEAHRRASERVINGLAARAVSTLALVPQRVPVLRVYNPIDDTLAPDGTPVEPDRLVFLSTANKGLRQVLRSFAVVRRALPGMELLIAGTSAEGIHRELAADSALAAQPGVRILGRLPQHELLRYTRSALCVFYPQSVHPETFGLIFAEANAVGTPVLAHGFGAAREVLNGDEQLVDADDTDAVVAKVRAWRGGARPVVGARPEFRAAAVVGEWMNLVERLAGR